MSEDVAQITDASDPVRFEVSEPSDPDLLQEVELLEDVEAPGTLEVARYESGKGIYLYH